MKRKIKDIVYGRTHGDIAVSYALNEVLTEMLSCIENRESEIDIQLLINGTEYNHEIFFEHLSEKYFAYLKNKAEELIEEKLDILKNTYNKLETISKSILEEEILNLENKENKTPQDIIIERLENLVGQRFNEKTLNEELSSIFNEEIKVELGYEDVEEFPDYDYMFESQNNEYGGDFDIYVLKHKATDFLGNDFYVTGVGYDFYN